jgi:hypothetical protein
MIFISSIFISCIYVINITFLSYINICFVSARITKLLSVENAFTLFWYTYLSLLDIVCISGPYYREHRHP